MSVASFHLLNKTSPLIRAAIVEVKKVNKPIDADGFTYGTNQPKMNPASMPHKGPSNGAVRLDRRLFENVIADGVPKTGYIGIHALTRTSAVQIPASAKRIGLARYLTDILLTCQVSVFSLRCNLLHNVNKTCRMNAMQGSSLNT